MFMEFKIPKEETKGRLRKLQSFVHYMKTKKQNSFLEKPMEYEELKIMFYN